MKSRLTNSREICLEYRPNITRVCKWIFSKELWGYVSFLNEYGNMNIITTLIDLLNNLLFTPNHFIIFKWNIEIFTI